MKKVCAVLLSGCLFLNSVAFGAAKKVAVPMEEETIGIRLFDGTEVYFESCNKLDAATQRGDAFFVTDACYGFTPLHWATFSHPHLVPRLLSAGAGLEIRSNGGLTPLHVAVVSGSYDVAKFLLRAGANPRARTDTGLTPLHLLYFPGCSSCSGDTLDPKVTRHKIAAVIANMGGDVNAKDDKGLSPLHYALMGTKASEDLTRLLALRAKVTARDKEGIPAEFYASLAGNTAASERTRVLAGNPAKMFVNGKTKGDWVTEKRAEIDRMRSTYQLERITRSRTISPNRDVYGASFWNHLCEIGVYGGGYVVCAFVGGVWGAFACGAVWTVWMNELEVCEGL